MNSIERELVIAYFTGGNAKERDAAALKQIFSVIKEAVGESKRPMAETFIPR